MAKQMQATQSISSWHIATGVNFAILAGLFSLGGTAIGSFFVLGLFPALVWWGWTLHERSLYLEQKRERAIIEKFKREQEV